jgi:3-hydroxybutyryl-CoA dehydrogenase
MDIVVCSDGSLEKELFITGNSANVTVIKEVKDFSNYPDADGYIDLLFENQPQRLGILTQLLPKPVLINSVVETLVETNTSYIRINAWPGFLASPLVEASANDTLKAKAEALLNQFGKNIQWLPDEPGFATPRIISMIINEAYLAFNEGVSTKEEIDTAMHFGTNYPYGPFEWAEKIGVKKVQALLNRLGIEQPLYDPLALLT